MLQRIVIAAVFAIVAHPKAQAQTWIASAGGGWNVAGNWSTGVVPGSTASATFNALGGPYTVTVSDSRTIGTIQLLSNDATITVAQFSSLSAATINVVAGTFSLTSGTLTVGSTFNVGTGGGALFSGGGLTGAGTLTGLMVVNGSMSMGNTAANPLVNAGTLLWQSGILNNSVGYSLANTGTIDLTADGLAFGTSNGNTLINRGTIRKSGGLFGSSDIGAAINFQGSTSIVDTTMGLLRFTGGGLLSGTTTFTGSGTAALAAGSFTVATGTTFTPTIGTGGNPLQWTGGVLGGGGELAGTLVANNSGGSSLFLLGSLPTAPIILTGTFIWKQGAISSFTNGSIANTTGTIDFANDGVSFTSSNSGSITNFSTIRKSFGSIGSTDVGFAVNLTGPNSKLEVLTGTLRLSGGGMLSGTTTTTGPGIAALHGGTFTIATGTSFTAQSGADGANLNWTGGAVAGGGTLRGTLVASGTESGEVMRIDSPASTPLLNAARIIWRSGTIVSYSSGVLVNTTGTLLFDGDGLVFGLGNLGSIQNQNAIVKSGGLTTTRVSWPVTNLATGTISNDRPGTVLNFSGGIANTGTITMVNGATIGGTITSNGGGIVQGPALGIGTYSGALTFTNGSTLKPGSGHPGGMQLNAGLVMQSGSIFHARLAGNAPSTGYSQVTVAGSIQLNGATLLLDNAGWNAGINDKLFLLVNDGSDAISSTFAGLPNGSTVILPSGGTAVIGYNGNYELGQSTTGGNDLVLYGFSAVPEPTSVMAVALGVVSWGIRFRRQAYARASRT